MNFLDLYLESQAGTEPPTIFHRWAAISAIGTLLGRRVFIQHGTERIYPNQYILFLGESGSRKSTAIKKIRKIVRDAGYNNIAASKTSKEKFLMDLEQGLDSANEEDDDGEDPVNKNARDPKSIGGKEFLAKMFRKEDRNEVSEGYIVSDELAVFLGHSNMEFIDMLTDLWDYEGVYRSRLKNSRSIKINEPTISLLGGSTGTNVALAFPPEVIGQGFFSRMITVFSEPSGRRIAWPRSTEESEKLKLEVIQRAIEISQMVGEVTLTQSARDAYEEIYMKWKELPDNRFASYSSRRHAHLFKVIMAVTAGDGRMEASIEDIILANTILAYAEYFMPMGLGEFGRGRNSSVASKVLEIINRSDGKPLQMQNDIWPLVRRDLDDIKQLAVIIAGFVDAGKVQIVNHGLIPVAQKLRINQPCVNFDLLTEYHENREAGRHP